MVKNEEKTRKWCTKHTSCNQLSFSPSVVVVVVNDGLLVELVRYLVHNDKRPPEQSKGSV